MYKYINQLAILFTGITSVVLVHLLQVIWGLLFLSTSAGLKSSMPWNIIACVVLPILVSIILSYVGREENQRIHKELEDKQRYRKIRVIFEQIALKLDIDITEEDKNGKNLYCKNSKHITSGRCTTIHELYWFMFIVFGAVLFILAFAFLVIYMVQDYQGNHWVVLFVTFYFLGFIVTNSAICLKWYYRNKVLKSCVEKSEAQSIGSIPK